MKKCKYCKSEIDSKAKNCPNCGKKQGIPVWLIVIIVLFILGIIASAGSNDNSEKVKEKNTSSETTSTDDNSSKAKFEYEVTSQYADEYGFSYYIEGTVANNTEKDYSYLQIEFICYDADGNNLGTALDNTNNLLAGQTWKYKAMFMGSDSETVDHCDYHEITEW